MMSDKASESNDGLVVSFEMIGMCQVSKINKPLEYVFRDWLKVYLLLTSTPWTRSRLSVEQ